MKRAIRRHHRRRIIKKYKDLYENLGYINYDPARTATHGFSCGSCYGCVNQRKYGELTLQEQKANITMSEQLREVKSENTCWKCKRFFAVPVIENNSVYCPWCGTEQKTVDCQSR